MKKNNLKEILSREDVQKGIKANLFKTDEEMRIAVDKTLNLNKENSTSVETLRDGINVEFENTLHVDLNKKVYFLECRLFYKENGAMVNSYLEVFDSEGKIVENYIDDVWDYADWKEAE